VLVYARFGRAARPIVCVCNLSPVVRRPYRVGLPQRGRWRELLNSDSRFYGGSDVGNANGVEAEPVPWHDQPCSAEVTLPPLGVLWLAPES
jgi:1,4-alpha-glucan branching enzyme